MDSKTLKLAKQQMLTIKDDEDSFSIHYRFSVFDSHFLILLCAVLFFYWLFIHNEFESYLGFYVYLCLMTIFICGIFVLYLFKITNFVCFTQNKINFRRNFVRKSIPITSDIKIISNTSDEKVKSYIQSFHSIRMLSIFNISILEIDKEYLVLRFTAWSNSSRKKSGFQLINEIKKILIKRIKTFR